MDGLGIEQRVWSRGWFRTLVLASAVAFALFAVEVHVRKLGLGYLVGPQWTRHRAVLDGTSPSPWQYRVLSEYVLEGLSGLLAGSGVLRPFVVACIAFRVVLDTAVLVALAWYCRLLGISRALTALGLVVAGYGLTYAFHNSDLSFNTHVEALLYLAAAVALAHGREAWLVPLTVVAALNRETSVFLPWLALGAVLAARVFEHRSVPVRRVWLVTLAAALAWIAVFASLRLAWGPRPLHTGGDFHPGLPKLVWNVLQLDSWGLLFAVMGTVPLLALGGVRSWPTLLRGIGLVVAPVWLVGHFVMANVDESRLFLVPYLLVFVPGGLLAVQSATRRSVEAPSASA